MITKARVEVGIVVDLSDQWSENCPVSQVRSQAIEAAESRLRVLFQKESGIRLVRAKATVVTMEDDE